MNLSIPVYVEERKVPGEAAPQFHLRPLFFEAPARQSRRLAAGMSKLAQDVRHVLDALATQPRQEGLVPWTFAPPLVEQQVKISAPLRRQTAECRVLVVAFEALGRRIAFAPSLPGLYFEVSRGQELRERAAAVIAEHLRRLEKQSGDTFELDDYVPPCARSWVTSLEIDVHPRPSLERPKADDLLALFSRSKPDGRAELAKVGRCLDWLYPDELDRVVLREPEVAELTRLLDEPDRRPVLLLGPRRVGKTGVVHETVYRRVAARQGAPAGGGGGGASHVAERNVWLISPARLISGMSYVGQWEGRLLAILEEAKRREHVLYFDDVLGLQQAGRSADSELNAAAVMRPWVERREFRMLAEMTPEAFNVLREQDRALADLFHVLPLREPGPAETRRILIHVARSLEDRHRCRFAADALPAAMDLATRYVRDQSMPGKAAAFLGQLGLKHRDADVDRAVVLTEFAARSGLSVSFLDEGARLARTQVLDALAKEIVGQEAALAAMADVVAVAKARLNDPGRPLGTLLFLGPTGVGKTAAAKALARYLYGDESRLLRFDMNEYLDPASPARLIGTFARPDGALTSAVRRQPYCVVLLDEIEKAHPSVFDVLLQVLGEGRLTDAMGRTSDFTNAVIILTSNLGTREAGVTFGLRPAAASRREVFLDAAREFFRPEFFNRIDRIVPFEPLGREQVAAIARRLIADLFRREGLVHRRCVLDLHPAAMARIVEEGYHPDLGARALKRSVERQLTAPIAARLAALPPDAPTVISIYPSAEGVAPQVQPLVYARRIAFAPPTLAPRDVDAALDRVEDFLNEVEERMAGADPGPSHVSGAALSPEHFRYFAVREQIQRIDRLIRQVDQAAGAPAPSIHLRRRTPRVKTPRRVFRIDAAVTDYSSLSGEGDVYPRLATLLADATPPGDEPADRLAELVQECALLEAMATDDGANRLLFSFRALGGEAGRAVADELRSAYTHVFSKQNGFVATPLEIDENECAWMLIEMPGARTILAGEVGTHVVYGLEGVTSVQVAVKALEGEADPLVVAQYRIATRERWHARVADGAGEPDPEPLGTVVRISDAAVATLDLRTGLICPNRALGEDVRRFILAGLPVPPGLAMPT